MSELKNRRGMRSTGALSFVVGLLTMLLVSPTAAHAAVLTKTISTVPAWNGNALATFGPSPELETVGQVITVPYLVPRLDSFSFNVLFMPGIKFRGYVYRWDSDDMRATGVARWSSLTMHTSGYTWQEVVLRTGGLRLVRGEQYVVFLSVSGIQQAPAGNDSSIGALVVGEPNIDAYKAGELVYLQNTAIAQWTTETWTELGDGEDLAFTASFRGP